MPKTGPYRRDYDNTRFKADATINSSNVGNLKLAWSSKIPGIGAFGGAASNPIIMGARAGGPELELLYS